MQNTFNITYTICFPIKNDKVLLLRRKKLPWIDRWNGAGGKIEPKRYHCIFEKDVFKKVEIMPYTLPYSF